VELALARAVGQDPGAAREDRPNCKLGVAHASPRLRTDISWRVRIEQSVVVDIFSFLVCDRPFTFLLAILYYQLRFYNSRLIYSALISMEREEWLGRPLGQ
jgi:hypothetical protein